MKIDTEKSFLEDALSFASREQRYQVADALFCHAHNTGQTLAGNTEETDVDWLAGWLWEDYASRRPFPNRIEGATSEQRAEWEEIARTCLRVMPRLQMRIASRLIALSKVLQDIERAERAGLGIPT